MASTTEDQPPTFVRLAAHPIRWHLLRELVRSDRSVAELTVLVEQPQNLVSYHLRQLRDAGLVRARRSSADGRDTFYAVDLATCRAGLQEVATALHPSLHLADAAPPLPHPRRRTRVLFLCTGNSARSQMAEALAVALSGGAVEARSAGSNPKAVHPNAVRVLGRRGIDISGSRSKHLDEVAGERFDEVVTLCDRVREVCPELRSDPVRIHWSIPDPTIEGSTNRESLPAFVRTADELTARLELHLPLLLATTRPRRSTDVHR